MRKSKSGEKSTKKPATAKFQVRQHDGFTFWVKSRQGNGEYLVDITALRGNGKCDCPHFRCRLEPKVNSDGNVRRCKHILAAREYVIDLMVKEAGVLYEDKGV